MQQQLRCQTLTFFIIITETDGLRSRQLLNNQIELKNFLILT